MRIKRPGPGISRGYNSLAGQSLGLTIGQKAPPDLMESLGFGPFETDNDPYWTQGFGPVHAHPNLWPAGMPAVSRGGQRLLARHGNAVGAPHADIRAGARSRQRVLRRAKRPPRNQHAHQLLSGAGAATGAGAAARRRAFGLWRVHDPQGRERARRTSGAASRRRLGGRSADRGRVHHQYRRSADALDQREVGFDAPSRRQSAGRASGATSTGCRSPTSSCPTTTSRCAASTAA